MQQEKDNHYIFMSPRTLRIGATNELQLRRFGCVEDSVLKVKLFRTENYNGNETLLQEADYQLEEGKKDSFLAFFVNSSGDDNAYDGRLQINGTICGKPISGSDRVLFSNSNGNIILIQTDKPLYKPGQDVNFRVLKLDQNLRPSNRANDTADVYVNDPQGTRLFQFKGVHLGRGIQQEQFPLADEPALGSWTITVDSGKDSQSTSFEDWWCRAGRGNAVKTRRVEQVVVSWPLPKNYSSRSYESSLDGAASECSNK
ncbi:pregnancy zone protein [Trichonephila clavipes]|nr:pregnancy zone protein [Trichonephila clavipes]